ncbi:hypothetical protein BH23GEM9_BH23GEM9_04350 [soil metagenome]
MKHSCWTGVLLLILTSVATHAQAVSAEPWFRAGTWMLSAELGGAAFTDFQRATARPIGADQPIGDFQRRVSATTTMTTGASVTRWVSDMTGVRAAVSYAPSRFSVWNAESAQRTLTAMGDSDRDRYASLGVWMASASAVFRLPLRLGRVVPYGLAGGGLVHYRMTGDAELPPEARRRFQDGQWTGPAAFFGLGGTLPLQRRDLLMSFELTNHLSRTPLDDEGRGEWFELSGIPLQLDRYSARDTDGIGMTSNLRLTVGFTLPLR